MNEAGTRAGQIDPGLKAVGWGILEGDRIRRDYLITSLALLIAVNASFAAGTPGWPEFPSTPAK